MATISRSGASVTARDGRSIRASGSARKLPGLAKIKAGCEKSATSA